MKKLTKIIAAISIAFSFNTAQADQFDDAFCEEFANTSASIMKGRQNGVPMSEYLKVLDAGSVFRHVVIEAYELPRMSYEPNKQRMIEDFRNEQELFCIKTVQASKKPTKKKQTL